MTDYSHATQTQTVQSLQLNSEREPGLWGSVVEAMNWATLGAKGVQVLPFTRGTSGWSDIYERLFERPAMGLQDKTKRRSPSESGVKHSSQQHHPLTYFWSGCGYALLQISNAVLQLWFNLLQFYADFRPQMKLRNTGKRHGGGGVRFCVFVKVWVNPAQWGWGQPSAAPRPPQPWSSVLGWRWRWGRDGSLRWNRADGIELNGRQVV